MASMLLIVALLLLCGLGDALGFVYAARTWQDGRFVWLEGLKCAASFQFGVVMYLLTLRELGRHFAISAEVQTLVWFSATIIGVAVLSGQLLRWQPTEQVVAAGVLAGIGWLLFRTGA
jgi:hypothetical protein